MLEEVSSRIKLETRGCDMPGGEKEMETNTYRETTRLSSVGQRSPQLFCRRRGEPWPCSMAVHPGSITAVYIFVAREAARGLDNNSPTGDCETDKVGQATTGF
jgi:hypothetical protein